MGVKRIRREKGPGHYGLPSVALPSASRGWYATWGELLTISGGCHGAAILLADQRDGSEECEPAGASAARPKGILISGSVAAAVPVRQVGIVR